MTIRLGDLLLYNAVEAAAAARLEQKKFRKDSARANVRPIQVGGRGKEYWTETQIAAVCNFRKGIRTRRRRAGA